MKIRKNRRKYLVVFNHITNEVVLSRPSSRYDLTISRNELGLLMFDCTFSEAKQNIRLGLSRGYSLIKKG